MRRIAAVLFVLSLVCCLTRPALAQEGSATLTGFIQDSSKAVIPGAKVLAIKTDTNTQFTAMTGKDGSYIISSLPVGPYQMQIEKPGFKTILKDNLFLHTQDALEVNFQMAVGSTSETVNVNGITTNDSPGVSMTVSREFVENMPLNGRSFQDLIQLAPGAVSDREGGYSINGQRTDANIYTVDGVSANLGGINNSNSGGSSLNGYAASQTVLGTTQGLVAIDSLQEFKIQTSGYTAEYGRSPGGQIQFTTRSGGNSIHGALFEYLRNTAFDANSSSNDYYGLPKSAEHQNDFGGTIGGPLSIPKLYNGKDKTFFFFSYEGLRLLLPASETEYVPTQAFRAWASPSVQPFLNASPLPNGPVNQDGCTILSPTTGLPIACDALFNAAYSSPERLDNISLRVDQTLGERLHAFLRYSDTPSVETLGIGQIRPEAINTHTWTAGLTAKLSSSFLDEIRFNYSRDGEEQSTNLVPTAGSVPWQRNLLIPAANDTGYAGAEAVIYVPGTSLETVSSYGSNNSVQHQYQLVDTLSWSRGKHSPKFGVDWRRLTPTYSSGRYFNEVEILSLADIQNGYATSDTVSTRTVAAPVFDNLSIYAQDHWAILPRLSLDYGLRWEFNPAPGPANGEYPAVLTSSNLAIATLAPLGTQPYKTRYDKLAPRFGFAWNAIPSGRYALTVRGGFGIFFDQGSSQIGLAYENSYPFYASKSLANVPLPLSNSALAPPSSNAIVPPYSGLNLSSPDLTLPYTEQWNLSVDESLNSNNTLTLSYVGNVGKKLLFTEYFSNAPYGNPNFSELQMTSNAAQSSYNALQLQDVGRLANGLDIVGSFTWAHARDNASTDDFTYAPRWGNSNNDLRRVLNVGLNYQTHAAGQNHWLRAITDGWVVANRFSAQSGLPINITQVQIATPGPDGGLDALYAPDLVPGVPIYLHGAAADVDGQPVPGSWRLNSAAFALVPTDPSTGVPVRQGTLGRNFVREPGFWALNTALERTFPVYEQLHLKFRAEAFNVLNHPNLGAEINTSLSSSSFGQLEGGYTTTVGTPNALYGMGAARSLQLSLRLEF